MSGILFQYSWKSSVMKKKIICNQNTMYRLRVRYNTILRRMLGLPPWNPAIRMFVSAHIRSVPELWWYFTFNFLTHIEDSPNVFIVNTTCTVASALSKMKCKCINTLFTSHIIFKVVFCIVSFRYMACTKKIVLNIFIIIFLLQFTITIMKTLRNFQFQRPGPLSSSGDYYKVLVCPRQYYVI